MHIVWLLQECLLEGKLDTAASYLIILQNLEQPIVARQVSQCAMLSIMCLNNTELLSLALWMTYSQPKGVCTSAKNCLRLSNHMTFTVTACAGNGIPFTHYVPHPGESLYPLSLSTSQSS